MTVVELKSGERILETGHVLTHKTFIKSETHTAHKQFGTLSCWTLYIVHTHTCLHAPFTDNLNLKLCSVSEPIVQCHVYQGGDQMQTLQSRV